MSGELRIGITPLTDSAPIVVALERGFFAQEGLQVALSCEPSWANIRDKLAAGALDAAHMLAPMPLAATLGVGPLQQPMATALSLGLGGNAITLSPALWRRMQELEPGALEAPAMRGRALAAAVYWTELHREVAGQLDIACPASDEKLEGPLLDGAHFDAKRALEALAAYAVHARRVPLEELAAAQG